MVESGAAGFWSYTHADDVDDSGGILMLAKKLQAEFSILTGESIVLFVDRDNLAWGEEWRRRIDDALSQTTFFIPVITPRYFKSQECRRELLTFSGQAQSLGIDELVLPVLYSEVSDLSSDSEDEAVALVARLQYVKWTEVRLAEPTSASYRVAVNSLAKRLVEIARSVAEHQVQEEIRGFSSAEKEEAVDFSALVTQIRDLLPEWLDSVRSDQFVTAQHDATSRLHSERQRKLKISGAPPSARLAQLMRYGVEELPLAERFATIARVYHKRTIELNPLVTGAVRLVRQHPQARSLLDELEAAVSEALPAILEARAKEAEGLLEMQEWARQNAHFSRVIRRVGQNYEIGHKLAAEANEVVLAWAAQFAALDSEEENHDACAATTDST